MTVRSAAIRVIVRVSTCSLGDGPGLATRYRCVVDLTARIGSGEGGFVLFAVTPPRRSTPAERLPKIANATIERLSHLDLDGLVLYDIDDEGSRNPVDRPFPFSPTVDPSEYRANHMHQWRTPVIVYRAVGGAATAVRDEWDAFDLLQALKSVLAAPRDGGHGFVFFDLDEYLAQIQGERHAKVTGCSGKLSTRSRARGRRSFSSVHRCSSMARSPTRSQSSTGHYPPSVRPAICSGRTTGH